jgi:serine/threonine protein kinase/tetratricopeptide (TPR) repeat protein
VRRCGTSLLNETGGNADKDGAARFARRFMSTEREGEKANPKTGAPGGLGRGDSIGRYLVLGLLGKGGMGEVYAAYDPELDRKVALKLLRAKASAGVDPSEGRARLLREAQAIARLSDPNVVVVFDVGMFGEQVFLAMEFVDGNTVGYWLQAQTRSWREVVRTFMAAGRGLASAHKAGLVHRDFKPDNVMITRDGQIRVMDFGLARTIDADGEAKPAGAGGGVPGRTPTVASGVPIAVDSAPQPTISPTAVAAAVKAHADWTEADVATRDLSTAAPPARPGSPTTAFSAPLTLTGAMMGTPAYMAPEQFGGMPLDARSDQFAFCVALYEGLYGERPFEGKNIHDLTKAVTAGRVRPAPAKARVPGWLRRVVLRGLRVNRDERYPSMEALLATLAKDPARARRRWAAAASVAGLIAVLGAGLVRAEREKLMRCQGADTKLAGIWELPVGTAKGAALSPRKEAIRRAFMATGKRYAADSFEVVRNALDRYVTDWNNMHRESCEATNIRGDQSAEVLDLRTSCLQDRFAEVRALTNVFSDATGDVVTKSVEAVQGIRPVEQCADIVALRAVVKPPDDPTVRRAVADTRTQLADVKALAGAGRFKEAMATARQALETARATRYDAVIAEALFQMGELESSQGDALSAETHYEEAVVLGEGSRHDEVIAAAEAGLIFVVGSSQGRTTEARRWARHAAAVLRRLGPGHDVVAAWRANNLAAVLAREGKLVEALQASREALAIKMAALGETHFDVGVSVCNVADDMFRLGRLDEAAEYNERGVRTIQRALGPDHPSLAPCLSNSAEVLNARGRYATAQALAERSLAILEQVFNREHPDLAYPLTALGVSLLEQGLADQAILALQRALAIREGGAPEAAALAETEFALARALDRDRRSTEHAVALAAHARETYRRGGSETRRIQEIDAWISSRSRAGALSMR